GRYAVRAQTDRACDRCHRWIAAESSEVARAALPAGFIKLGTQVRDELGYVGNAPLAFPPFGLVRRKRGWRPVVRRQKNVGYNPDIAMGAGKSLADDWIAPAAGVADQQRPIDGQARGTAFGVEETEKRPGRRRARDVLGHRTA